MHATVLQGAAVAAPSFQVQAAVWAWRLANFRLWWQAARVARLAAPFLAGRDHP